MNMQRFWVALASAICLALQAGPVLAVPVTNDASTNQLPAPGILGLVVIGVAGAIAIAKRRK